MFLPTFIFWSISSDTLVPWSPWSPQVTRYTGGLSQLPVVEMSWEKKSKKNLVFWPTFVFWSISSDIPYFRVPCDTNSPLWSTKGDRSDHWQDLADSALLSIAPRATIGRQNALTAVMLSKAAQKLRHSTRIGRHVPLTSPKDLEVAIFVKKSAQSMQTSPKMLKVAIFQEVYNGLKGRLYFYGGKCINFCIFFLSWFLIMPPERSL